jgi:hypothetical protein
MAATTFLVFYRFKSMNSDEAAKAKSEWNNLRIDWWSKFKDNIRWYIEQTHTIAARRR